MDKSKTIFKISCAIVLVLIVLTAIFNTMCGEKPKDLNVYLSEEVCFSDGVYIKVVRMNVTENENVDSVDNDGDSLSKYILNLELSIQRRSEKTKNKPIKIEPKMFQLKNVNLKSKSKMAVFFESMFKATLSALVSGSVDGEISIIEETIGFAEEYISGTIENAETLKTDFKPISADVNSFEMFTLDNQSDAVSVMLHFPIKQEYLESENVIVLAIDTKFNWEKWIFLITRPNEN